MQLKVLIATGGSGGHLFPAQQCAKELKNAEVHFAGHKLQNSPFFDQKFPYFEIASSNRNPFTLLRGLWQSLKLLWKIKPDVVVGFGSFHSFPVMLAAVLLRKKIVLFEANCSFGKVNQLFLPFAKKVALQFPVVKKKAVLVPLLPWGVSQTRFSQKEARVSYGLDPDVFTILVFGGSQGASFINEAFERSANLLKFPFQVIHFTGKNGGTPTYSVKSCVKPFETEMARAYSAADIAVCRCGAGTTAELIRFQLPSVLIPYPFAYDHQRHNGEFLQKEGSARVLLQKEATVEKLAAEIQSLRENLALHKEALQKMPFGQTTEMSALISAIGEKK